MANAAATCLSCMSCRALVVLCINIVRGKLEHVCCLVQIRNSILQSGCLLASGMHGLHQSVLNCFAMLQDDTDKKRKKKRGKKGNKQQGGSSFNEQQAEPVDAGDMSCQGRPANEVQHPLLTLTAVLTMISVLITNCPVLRNISAARMQCLFPDCLVLASRFA